MRSRAPTPCPVAGCTGVHESYQILCETCFKRVSPEAKRRLATAKAAVRKYKKIARQSSTVVPSEVTQELFRAENAALEEVCS